MLGHLENTLKKHSNYFAETFRKLRFVLKEVLNKISIEKTIWEHDKSSCLDVMPGGSVFFRKIFEPPELDFDISYDEYGTYVTRNISANVANLASNIIELNSTLITKYIGKSARLDDLYIRCDNVSVSKKRGVSEGWHHDHCGHRIKVWMCLKGDGSMPTLFVPNTHKRSVMMSLNQLKRIFGRSDYAKKAGSIEIGLKSGDVGIFDTNGLHRGGFNERSTERICLVIEFISRDKCNLIADRAPCGPGGSAVEALYLSHDVKEILYRTNFLDNELLMEVQDGFTYSLANRSLTHI